MKTLGLDVHKDWCQLTAVDDETDEVCLEMKVRTDPEELQRVVAGIPGPKRLVMEEGAPSARLVDALRGLVEEIISCDPTVNALIAGAEDHNDENDARRLITLRRAGALRPVYTPPEPYRTLRSLLGYDHRLGREMTRVRNQIKGLCRRTGFRYRGVAVYPAKNRPAVLDGMPNAALRWEMESLFRRLEALKEERRSAHRVLSGFDAELAEIERLQSIPGVGPTVARTLVAWIVDPARFRSRPALSSYAGLGISQKVTHWKATGKAVASRRGQPELKRVLYLAAAAAVNGRNAWARRFRMRMDAGWERRKAIRDVARRLLFTGVAVWRNGTEYQDAKVAMPSLPGTA